VCVCCVCVRMRVCSVCCVCGCVCVCVCVCVVEFVASTLSSIAETIGETTVCVVRVLCVLFVVVGVFFLGVVA